MRTRSHKRPSDTSGFRYFKYGRNDVKRLFIPDPWIVKEESCEEKEEQESKRKA